MSTGATSTEKASIISAVLAVTLASTLPVYALRHSDYKAEIRARAETIYRLAAQGKWSDAYALYYPPARRDTSIERFTTLFSNHRPFRCTEIRVTRFHEEDLEDLSDADIERAFEVSLRLKVEYADGRRETLRRYSDLWVKYHGEWYLGSNRKGPLDN